MLGENHSLTSEFPTLTANIKRLCENSQIFATMANEYDALDTEIRHLELQNSPIEDALMHAKKQRRALLKDELYQQLTTSSSETNEKN